MTNGRTTLLPVTLLAAAAALTVGARAEPSSPAPADEAEPDDAATSVQGIAGWVVTAVGGAAFISTVVTGALAIHKHQQLAVLCPHRSCEPALHADVDQFNAFRTAATASAITAGAATVVGVSLLLTAPERADGPADAVAIRLLPAAGGAWLEGVF